MLKISQLHRVITNTMISSYEENHEATFLDILVRFASNATSVLHGGRQIFLFFVDVKNKVSSPSFYDIQVNVTEP